MNRPHSRFVVVDDDEEDAFILCQLLERSGVTDRVLCRSSEAALQWLASVDGHIPEVALIDARLLGKSGFDVLKAIRDSEKLRGMIVVMLSASDEPRNLGKATQLGADAYVVKFPSLSAMREIVAAIHRAAESEEPRTPLSVSCNLLLAASTSTR